MYRAWLAFALACVAGAATVVLALASLAVPSLVVAAAAAALATRWCYRRARERLVDEVYERVGAERNPDGTLGDPGAEAQREATGRVEYEPRDDWDDAEDWPWDDPFWTADEPIEEMADGGTRTVSGASSDSGGGEPTGDPSSGGPDAVGRVGRTTREACEVLGVDPDAEPRAIRRAYRERVMETHPDHGGDREAFERVRWAYEHLRSVRTGER